MTQIPAGWYPDPAATGTGMPAGQRYWDGQQWTPHVSGPVAAQSPRPAYGRPTTPDGQPLASWWQRAGAAVLDSLIVGIASGLLGLPFLISYGREYLRFMERQRADLDSGGTLSPFAGMTVGLEQLVILTLIGLLVGLTYHAVFLRRRGATPGKMVLGLRVRLRERPGQLPWSAIARRLLVQNVATLFTPIPFASLAVGWFPLLDVLWPLWDDKRQALHDKAAGTNVVVDGG
ncbi:MAG TPA: RDD family protein [Nocardioidaceae bacterium]|nr:RDD family protein [Nocardioidaceae bacterium]